MPTIAELGAKLLTDAAAFLRSIGEQNPAVTEQMEENASVFEQIAPLLHEDPMGALGNSTHHELAAKLLSDAAIFFRSVGDQNDAIKAQMYENADVYAQMADLVTKVPTDTIDIGDDQPIIHIKKDYNKNSED